MGHTPSTRSLDIPSSACTVDRQFPTSMAAAPSGKTDSTSVVGPDPSNGGRHPGVQIRRVAIVLSELRRGGMERVVVHLASHLAACGIEPVVICLQNAGPLSEHLRAAGISVVALNSTRGNDLPGLVRLAGTLRQFRPDVVNVHDYSSLPYVAIATSIGCRSPIVFTAHGLLYEGFERLRRRQRFFARWIGALVAVSEPVRTRHTAYLNWKGKTRVIPNGIPEIALNPGDRRAVRQELKIPESEFVFLTVGNARPEKAFEDLISAAVDLQAESDTSKTFSVVIAGEVADDAYGRQLRRISEASGVPGLRLLGYRSDAGRLYSAADAFVLSSRSEGLPLVLLEAMTAGLPVIATRVGGIPDAVPPECGRLVDPQRPEELARAMQSILTADRGTLHSIGSAARSWAVQEYGVERMVRQYVELYADLANAAPDRSKR